MIHKRIVAQKLQTGAFFLEIAAPHLTAVATPKTANPTPYLTKTCRGSAAHSPAPSLNQSDPQPGWQGFFATPSRRLERNGS
jgi:hypothetical protein